MKKRAISISILLLGLMFLPTCRGNTPTTSEISPTAVMTDTTMITSEEHSVVLISWDGSRADLVYDLMDEGLLPTFASMATRGVRAEYVQSIDPPLTAAAHNSISSGSYPSRTGIISNSYHVIGDDFYWYRRGYDEPMDDAEPIWVTASKAGLTTASVFFIGGTPALAGQTADYTIGYGIEDSYSKQWDVNLSTAEGWTDMPQSFSPALSGSFTIQDVGLVYLYVLDSTDDNTPNHDTVVLNTERSGGFPAQILKESEWGSLILLKRTCAGAEFLIQEITPERVTLYHTGIEHNTAAPAELLKALNEIFGPFPAGGDSYALENGWISEEDFLYLLERQSVYMAKVAAWVYRTYQPDLMFTWQDPFDSAGHQFLMTNPRQQSYSPENAVIYAGFYTHAAQVADSSLAIMLEAIDLNDTTILLVGDNGMAPIHSTVYVNTILEKAGLLTLDNRNYVVLAETKAFAIASGGSVNVYINLMGRESGGGTVSADEYPAIQVKIITLFRDLVDPETSQAVFQRVLPRGELLGLGLDHPNSGDVFAQANPGYHLDGWRGVNYVFSPTDFYGQHGYDSSLPEMHTIFIATGYGIPLSNTVIPPLKVVDYAPTIAWLLGFSPAGTVDGSIIPAFIQP
jgi:predicted AlkP superfamily pyrophosphatase or phosphodiesterase